jgi:eukaryotic-like serine/threonine-protein kinase
VFLPRGTQFGPYEVLELLGAGGMGEVYHARDPRLDRTVAIKILLAPRDASPTQLERFRREARSIGRISHPHICTLHDVGEQDGVPFLVMEYLDGETLSERLERGAIPIEQAIPFAIQIAEALSALHDRGVIHRDLKPSNVMLTAGGVKLLDFGLAKLRDGEYAEVVTEPTKSLSLTDPGSIVGTLPYMAPEQIEGQPVDTRTDIFSFGVVLYEMIAGRRPFAGDTRAALMASIVGVDAPSLSTLQPRVSRSLERLIRRCLAKSKDDRWQTARDLAAEIRGLSEQNTDTMPAAPAPIRRGRRAWIIAALVAASLAGGVFASRAAFVPRRATVAEFLPATYRHGVVTSARFAPDGQSLVYSASWEGRPLLSVPRSIRDR